MEGYSSEGSWSVNGTHSLGPDDSEYWMKLFDGEFGSFTDTNEISGGGGAMESINDPLNQLKTSQRKENKRQFDGKCRLKLKEKMAFLQGLIPGCSKVTSQVSMLEEIIDYVQSLQRQVEEKTYEQVAEILHLKKEKERLNAENTKLKDQVGLLLGKKIEHEYISLQLCSLETNELLNQLEGKAPVNAANLISEGNIILPHVNRCHLDVESQLNSTEAPRDACLQVQEIPHKNGMESESVFQSNEEAKQGTCLSGNESDEAEFRSGGAEDEPSALDGPSGEPTAKLLSSKKRKRSVEEAEVDQARGGQLLNKALKDSSENLEKGDQNLTTTDKSTGKQGRGGSQTSDPLKEVYLNIRSRRCKSTMSCSLVIPETEKGKIMRFLRGVVPGCSEVPAKAAILDETNNHVQSLPLIIEVFKLNSAFETVHTDILMKLEADDESTVKFSDFTGLDGERIKVGKYSVPLSLLPIVKNIIHVYGDVSATGKMNPYVAEAIYIMFCASVKEMSELRIEQVTEDRILKWRDAIKDALRSNFKVDFAMEHLKKIACAYIDLTEHLKLENEALRMFNFEAELSAGTEEFSDMPVSSGDKPIPNYESVNGGGDDFDGVSYPPAGKKRQLMGSQVEFPDRSFEVENKLDPERKLVLTMEAELEKMKELIREDEVAVQEKGEEYEMLMRKKQSVLAMEADAEKVVDDFTVFTKAIEKDTNTQIIYERAMMNTIRSTLEALIQEA